MSSPGVSHRVSFTGVVSSRSAVAVAMVLVGVVVAVVAAVGVGVGATGVAAAAVDEPQYLLTALSLGEDRSFDIGDELREERWRPFADLPPPVQTSVRPDGAQVSPHDPLLPLLLAVPMTVGGWVAAKLTLAALAGILAALLVWVAVRRYGVPLRLAAPGVALALGTAPLTVYGQQVYPELPAALAVTVAVATLPAIRRRPALLGYGLAVVALPWLSVKYGLVAAALAAIGLVTLWRAGARRSAGLLAGGLAVAGAAYLGVHHAIWGGWTVYASGDAFEGSGEFGVVGFQPNYPGRSIRLLGLIIDRDFGLAAWQPAWLLLLPAFALLLRLRPPGWVALALPFAAGWSTATWVALTMQGFWWPGRQVVCVLPLAVLAILVGLARYGRAVWVAVAGLATVGVGYLIALLAVGYAGRTWWVLAPDRTDLHPGMAWLLPDDRVLAGADVLRYVLWTVLLLGSAVLVFSRPGPGSRRSGRSSGRPGVPAPGADRTPG